MHVTSVERWVISKEIANMMVISHLIINLIQIQVSDTYDPVVGKWMTNLVATTPIMAKAMKNLYAELNRQKELKRSYRRKYKNLHVVTATTSTTPTTTTRPLMTTSSRTPQNIQPIKTVTAGQQKKPIDKGKVKPVDKKKKSPPKTNPYNIRFFPYSTKSVERQS